MPELRITSEHLERDAYLYIRQSTPRQVLLTLPMMMHRMAPIWPEGAMQRLFAFVVMLPIGVVAFVVLRNRQSWERPLVQDRVNA